MGEQKRSGSFSWHARKIEEILFSSKWIFTRKMNCIELCEPRKMMPTSSTNCLLFALKESIILKPKLLMVWAHRIDTWWKVYNNGDFRSLLKNGKNLPLAQAMMIHSRRRGNAMINFIFIIFNLQTIVVMVHGSFHLEDNPAKITIIRASSHFWWAF